MGWKKREGCWRRRVAKNEDAKFGKERSRAGGGGGGAVWGGRPRDKRRGKQMRGKITERNDRLHGRGEEMAGLQRSSRFKSGPPFHGHRLLRKGLGETVSERR